MLPQPQPFLLEQKHPLLPQRLEAIPNSPKGIPIGIVSSPFIPTLTLDSGEWIVTSH